MPGTGFRRLEEAHDSNVTPFIDVTLVLLIIFMVAAPLATVDVKVDLPASAATPEPRPAKPIFLTVQADLTLRLGDAVVQADVLGAALDQASAGEGAGTAGHGTTFRQPTAGTTSRAEPAPEPVLEPPPQAPVTPEVPLPPRPSQPKRIAPVRSVAPRAAPVAPTRPVQPPPPTSPAQSAPSAAAAANWQSWLLAHLTRFKRYPPAAQMRREQGITLLRFRMTPAGQIVSFRLERSSGHALLDQETLDLLQRAQPLPALPEAMPQQQIELVVPLRYELR